MNKSQLVDALADRLGDRRAAATAVDAVLQIVVDTVRSGESVSLAGFGVFESRARAARTGRNPRTGETVAVPATTVPAFRPGTGFRSAVADDAVADDAVADDAVADDAVADDAEPRTAPPPRRRASAAPATNGAGGEAAGAALHGAVELSGPATTTLVGPTDAADVPVKDKKAKHTKAAKHAPKAVTKEAGAKNVAKAAAKDKGGKKKGKKGK